MVCEKCELKLKKIVTPDPWAQRLAATTSKNISSNVQAQINIFLFQVAQNPAKA